jgi:hypothetical protein
MVIYLLANVIPTAIYIKIYSYWRNRTSGIGNGNGVWDIHIGCGY